MSAPKDGRSTDHSCKRKPPRRKLGSKRHKRKPLARTEKLKTLDISREDKEIIEDAYWLEWLESLVIKVFIGKVIEKIIDHFSERH